MTQDQWLIFGILGTTIVLFLFGRWRHDLIALLSLLACVLAGLTPSAEAFLGFAHPAVITVAAILILSHGLQKTGAVESMAQRLLPDTESPLIALGALTLVGALLSAFMNNVGAMALLMPIAMQHAARQGIPPGKVLMPLAFGTILGGMTTLIGTPPNLIVAGFRAEHTGSGFTMFDFTPVGLGVALVGIIFAVAFSRWLVPHREQSNAESFDTGTYLTEVRIGDDASLIDKTLREAELLLEDDDAQIVGMVRNDFRVTAPLPGRRLHAGDILVIEAEPESLGSTLTRLGLKLEESVKPEAADDAEDEDDETTEHQEADNKTDGKASETSEKTDISRVRASRHNTDNNETADEEETPKSTKRNSNDEIVIQELVIQPNALLLGLTATDLQIRSRFGINLLAISRQGHRSIKRLRWTELDAGDVMLMQGPPEAIAGFASEYQCIPLAQRPILIPNQRKAWTALGIMLAAVLAAATGSLSAALAFTAGVVGYMVTRVVPVRRIYDGIDWPIIVLLGALMPMAAAMANTGAADLLAQGLLDQLAQGNAIIALTLTLIITMTLSDFMNNAATAAVMCPIAISIAAQLGVDADSFLMAVAIGASCAFLTPIGHQNNTLILGPGGFRFSDYWRLGLPMEILVVLVSIPLLLFFWPL
ncbi:SLC13 family permease [Halopseudomonas salegens]|uniref:TrkA-C domain-containing protein n=1 Tax=Halopseudomonas salegens TaxID=1434072 RepID=A0A1H2DY86_9GAMM|nr:SLC13 family permease [Halopseudomonas salegens]SDT87807.1 TrkA-C domain-containing protein [Halopseudomonas salegens]